MILQLHSRCTLTV